MGSSPTLPIIMKICKTCGEKFPKFAKINGMWKSLATRANCLECVPFGTSPHASFDRELYLAQGRSKSRAYAQRFKDKNNQYPSTVRRAQYKEKFTSLVNGCQFCGYNRSQRNLTFHHVDESTKEFNLSTREFQYSFARIKTELLKCVVACHLCHGDIHDELIPAEQVAAKHQEFRAILDPYQTWPE